MGNYQKIVEFISEYIEQNIYPPTYKEIREALGLSVGGLSYHLNKLEEKGIITRSKGGHRTIRVIEPTAEQSGQI